MGRKKGLTKRFKQEVEKTTAAEGENGAVKKVTNADILKQRQEKKKTDDWGKPFAKTNASFEEYYKENGVVPPEEYDAFLETLRKELPTAFRIVKSGYFVDDIVAKLERAEKELPKEVEVSQEFALAKNAPAAGEEPPAKGEAKEVIHVTPPQRIPWYPGGLAWQFDVPRGVLRRSPELTRFHQFLLMHTEEGNISRQEAVSMIPVLFLDVQKDNKVLDLCAAPGSKTGQILEALRDESIGGKGMVVANDADTDRCYLLVNRTKKLGSPQFLVTTHKAESFPLNLDDYFFKFDRVLCDVPCSGDGTTRKNPDIWKKWNPYMGIGLHRIQSKIAKRGINLLAVGGKMVYSTCSMNPMEDEAVVAELLRSSKGAMRLVDCHSFAQQSNLIAHRGVSSWRVYFGSTAKVKWASKFEEVPEEKRRKVSPSLFPPTEEEAKEFHLERCMRFLPQSMNTGGFFVAVLEKTKESEDDIEIHKMIIEKVAERKLAREKEAAETKSAADAETKEDGKEELDSDEEALKKEEEKRAKKSWTRKFGEDPIIPLSEIDGAKALWEKIVEFYDIRKEFPFEYLVSRTVDLGKIFLTCPAIMDIVHANSAVKIIRSVNTGLKLFKRTITQKQAAGTLDGSIYRLCNESLHYILPYLGEKRIVKCEMADVLTLLKKSDPFFTDFTPKVQERLKELEMGCVVFIPTDIKMKPNQKSDSLALCTWRGKSSAHLLIEKAEVKALKATFCEEAYYEELKQIEDAQKLKSENKRKREEAFKEKEKEDKLQQQ